MARSPAEIQADIALTRRSIEQRLDALQRHVPHRWWMPYAVLAGGLATGVLLSRVPLLAFVGAGARTVQAAISVAAAVAAIDRFIADRRPERTPRIAPRAEQVRQIERRAS